MGYIEAVTKHLVDKGNDAFSRIWTETIEQTKTAFSGDPEIYRDDVVGLQAEWDRVFNQVCDENSVAIIMTGQVASPFTHNDTNIEEIAEAKRPSLEARIKTSREMLKKGSLIIIAAPQEAWDSIEGTSQGEIWEDLSNEYNNLVGVAVDVPKGVNGALNLVGDEMASINFTQAQQDSPVASEHFVMAGNFREHRSLMNRVQQIVFPIVKAANDQVNYHLSRLRLLR